MESKPSSPELPEPSSLGARLHLVRTQAGVTMEDLAAASGVAKTYISKLELGRVAHPSAIVTLGIAKKLKVDPFWLVFGAEPRNPFDPALLAEPGALPAALRLLADAAEEAQFPGNGGLPLVHAPLTSAGVLPASLPELITRLETATLVRGSRAALMRELGLSSARLSQWLSGRRKPDAEMTLRLLAWVQAAEAQKGSPASVLPPAGPKTRSRKSSDEKPESNPP